MNSCTIPNVFCDFQYICETPICTNFTFNVTALFQSLRVSRYMYQFFFSVWQKISIYGYNENKANISLPMCQTLD